MAVTTEGQQAVDGRWYAHTPDEVAAALNVQVKDGLPAQRAAELLTEHGPNALPEEKTPPAWRQFLDQYRAYMQLILCGTAIVSLLISRARHRAP